MITSEVLAKLESAYLLGCTDLEACLVANISTTALYSYQEKNPEFADRKKVLQQSDTVQARKVLSEAMKDGDKVVSLKHMERKEGSRVKISGDADSPLVVTEVIHRII